MRRINKDVEIYALMYINKIPQVNIAEQIGCSTSTISSRHMTFEQIHTLVKVLHPTPQKLYKILKSSAFYNYANMKLCKSIVNYINSNEK